MAEKIIISLLYKNPAIAPKNEIKAKVLTPPRVHTSFSLLEIVVSLSSPITDPKSKAVINFIKIMMLMFFI